MTPAATTGSANDEAARTAKERSNLYGFLAATFRAAPTAELLRSMKEPHLLSALASAGGELESGFFDRSEDELIEKLAVEYTRLFLGPGPHIAPYSAVYLGGEGALLCGAPTTWVRRVIEAAGFDLRPEFRSLPDHIAVELEFMREMTRREAAAWERCDDTEATRCQNIQAEFIATHMSRWIPTFCDKITRAAELPLYREVARITAGFIESERQEADGRWDRPADALMASSGVPS